MKRKILLLLVLLIGLLLIPRYFTNNRLLLYLPVALLLIILLFLLFKLLSPKDLKKEFNKDRIGSLKNIIEIFALIFAGVFFLSHFAAQLEVTDLKLELSTNRVKVDPSSDSTYLVVDVKLSAGTAASADLQTIKAYLYGLNSIIPEDSMLFLGYDRLKIYPDEGYAVTRATYNAYAGEIDTNKKYTIATNESTQFSSCKLLRNNNPYRVELIVITRNNIRLHRSNSQYRASATSLPASK